MTVGFVPFDECDPLLDWLALIARLEAGHALPAAQVQDMFMYRGSDTLLSRCAWIDGLGVAVKSATIFPGNRKTGKATTNGGVCIFSDRDGVLEAMLDFHLVTKWKTAGDSILAASKLARKGAGKILIVGAGAIAHALCQAYGALLPDARFAVWSRRFSAARALAAKFPGTTAERDLESAVRNADIISCATMATEPLIMGDWLQPGQHVDLIGAYRPDMREADDRALQRSRIFVDSRATTLDHIGELKTPLAEGIIAPDDIIADFYDLGLGRFARTSDTDITLFKNGGGAHLDLMTGRYVLDVWSARKP